MARKKGAQYRPGSIVGHQDIASLERTLVDELTSLAKQLATREIDQYTALNSEPEKPREGMSALADGTNWDPGYGAGWYVYVGGSWEPSGLPDGSITSDKLASGAVGTAAPEYIEVGNIGADLSGSINTNFKTIKSFSSVTLNAGEKIAFQFRVSVAAKLQSDKKRKIQVQLVLDGNAIGNGIIIFKKEKFQTRSTVVVNGYEAESTLSGNLTLEVRADATSKFVIQEGNSTYYVYARIPDQ